MHALHLAVSAIRNGECDGAVVAAANWLVDPSMQIVLDKLGALSPTSRCHTFDESADGYARGEGYCAIYLKKSSLACLERLPVRAMIRGTAINANGKTGGITRPSAKGQEAAIRQAYENAGNIPFSDTTFFECHGTGTQAGDPIEVSAIGSVFASSRSDAPEDRLLIGSIKPSLGHTEGASALASIMKAVLSLEAGEIPPTYGVENLNPKIDFESAKVFVVKDGTIPWPKDKVRRVSVNSFGYGGANGHCIIDHVNNVLPEYVRPGMIDSSPTRRPNTREHINGNLEIEGHLANKDQNASSRSSEDGSFEYNGNGDSEKSDPPTLFSSLSNSSSHISSQEKPDKGVDSENKIWGGQGSSMGNAISAPASTASNIPYHSPIASAQRSIASVKAMTRQLVLLPFSAHNAYSLESNINALSKVIDQWGLADIAYTLGCKRSRLQQRSFRIVERDNLAQGLADEKPVATSPIHTSRVAFVFTGQGAQWHTMGAQLYEYAVFRATINFLDRVLEEVSMGLPWTILETLSGGYEADHIQSPKVSQVACTAIQIAMVDLLASWSVRPMAVVGHSSGEMAAAYASGHITAAEAITAAYFRGEAVSRNKMNGAMLAVGLGADQVTGYLEGKDEHVCIAAMNSPGSVTLSGDETAIEALSTSLVKDGVFNRILRTSGTAYHSHHMMVIGGDYIDMLHHGADRLEKLGLADRTQRHSRVPWVSSVTPDRTIAEEDGLANYWRANLESPVRFSQAVMNMMSPTHGPAPDVLIELGPHPALKGPLEQILKEIGKSAQYIPSLQRNIDGRESLLHLAGSLFGANAEIDLVAMNSVDNEGEQAFVHGCTAVDLPAYQYMYGPVNYYESRQSKEYRLRDIARHDLLGSQVPGTSKIQPQWSNLLRVKDVPWLNDHRLLPGEVSHPEGRPS